jgi:glycosyltransferase involved in cell wall biosynthesis
MVVKPSYSDMEKPFLKDYIFSEDLPLVVINNPLMPLISIVTPSFNQGEFIKQTIESVLQQDYPNIEYWVIDGESQDDTVSILKAYESDPRFNWISESDKGQSDAINKGWSRCRGDILAWINSDDYYIDNTFAKVANIFKQNDQCSLVYGNQITIDVNGGIISENSYQVPHTEMLEQLIRPWQPTTFIRKTAIEKVGMVNPKFCYAMDWEYFLRLMSNYEFIYLPEKLSCFRLHNLSKSCSATLKFIPEILDIMNYMLENRGEYPKLTISKQELRAKFYRHISRHYYMGDRYKESLFYIWLAISAYPQITLSVLQHELPRLLLKSILPIDIYRKLSAKIA